MVPGAEAPSSEDAAVVEAAIDSLHGELTKFGGAAFTTASIPEWAQDPMRDCVAFRVAPTFGLPGPRIADLAAVFTASWQQLIRQTSALAATSTKVDLRNRVLQQLSQLRPGEISPAAHAEIVDDQIDHVFAWYTERGTLGFDALSIPDWAITLLRDMVAYKACRQLGINDAPTVAQLSQQHDLAMLELDQRMVALNETNTRNQLRNLVLVHLNIIGIAEKPTPAQQELMGNIIDNTFTQLQGHELITFAATAIPGWAMLSLRDYMAYVAAPSFRVDPGRYAQLFADHRQAFGELRAQQQPALIKQPAQAEYF